MAYQTFDPGLENRPIRDIAYEQLKHAIITGQIPAGSRIVETVYADQLHISRTPLREALRKLERDGLVEYVLHRGVVVRAFTIDDIAGGFYAYGRYPGYPYDFSLETVLKLNDDNTIEVVDQNPKDWFWELAISITSGTYDPETGTIKLELDFDGDPMKVTLTK